MIFSANLHMAKHINKLFLTVIALGSVLTHSTLQWNSYDEYGEYIGPGGSTADQRAAFGRQEPPAIFSQRSKAQSKAHEQTTEFSINDGDTEKDVNDSRKNSLDGMYEFLPLATVPEEEIAEEEKMPVFREIMPLAEEVTDQKAVIYRYRRPKPLRVRNVRRAKPIRRRNYYRDRIKGLYINLSLVYAPAYIVYTNKKLPREVMEQMNGMVTETMPKNMVSGQNRPTRPAVRTIREV